MPKRTRATEGPFSLARRRPERNLAAFARRAAYALLGVRAESGWGVKPERAEGRKVMALAQRRDIGAGIVTESSRWGRTTFDLLHSSNELEFWHVSVIAINGLAFNLFTPHARVPYARMMASIIAGIGDFERAPIRERI